MRLLPNVIKASEYVSVKNGSAFPSNNGNLQNSSNENVQDQHRMIVNEAFQKAQQIMEAAQNYSMNKVKESTQQMNQEAAQVLVQSREEGYRKGFLEGEKVGRELGYKDGLKNAEAENQAVAAELSTMLETVETMKCEILRKYEEDIEKLAVAIAEKVIKRELSIDEKAMQSIITNAVDSYRNQEWIRILVSKNTKTLLQNVDKSIVQALSDVSDNIKIEVSPDMNDGDCTIEMPDQMIDASVNTQIDKIKHILDT